MSSNGGHFPRSYPVAEPALVGREREYVLDCIDSTWISSNGKYIERFEQMFAEFCGARHALSCTNGTVALHLALLALGVGPGDEVLVPSLTYVASANSVVYCGAKPVFVDSEPTTWNVDPQKIERAISERTKAIMVVHLYGHPADMGPILSVACRHGLPVIEDAAEAHGATYRGRPVGSLGTVGTFSFYGNKIITTGEGGMVTTNDDDLALKIRMLKGQGQSLSQRYWFPMVGYNYRMTNIAAAIGVAQMERADWHVNARRQVASWYRDALAGSDELSVQPEQSWAKNAYWMNSVVLRDDLVDLRDPIMEHLAQLGIETRPFFPPIHTLPPYAQDPRRITLPVSESIASRGFNVPSSSLLTGEDVEYIAGQVQRALVEVVDARVGTGARTQ